MTRRFSPIVPSVLIASGTATPTLFSAPAAFTNQILGTEVVDTDNAYNPTTGMYTIPHSGIYDVLASIRLSDSTTAAGEANFGFGVDVVGTTDSAFFAWYGIGTGMRQGFMYNHKRQFTAGQVVRLFTYANNGGSVNVKAGTLAITFTRPI